MVEPERARFDVRTVYESAQNSPAYDPSTVAFEHLTEGVSPDDGSHHSGVIISVPSASASNLRDVPVIVGMVGIIAVNPTFGMACAWITVEAMKEFINRAATAVWYAEQAAAQKETTPIG